MQGFGDQRSESFGSLGALQRDMLASQAQQVAGSALGGLFDGPLGSMRVQALPRTPSRYQHYLDSIEKPVTFYTKLKEEITDWLKIAI